MGKGSKIPRNLMAVFLLLAGQSVYTELKWETTSQEIKVHPLQRSTTVEFDFSNSGDEPVTILELNPDCGCLSGQVDKKTFGPGETGTVQVKFNLQGRFGDQRKGMTVITDDHSEKPTRLTVSTSIPRTYDIVPQRLVWMPGGKHRPQTFVLSNVGDIPIRIEKAASSNKSVAVDLKTIRDAYEYEVIVSPEEGLGKTLTPIIIYPEKPEGMDQVRTYTVYALVW